MFGIKSIDSVIGGILRSIEHLHVIAEAHTLDANMHDAVAIEKAKLAAFARSESARAKAIALKFTALVTPDTEATPA